VTTVVSERMTFGVIVPSTNTVVEAEYNDMRPPGVSYHAGRIYIPNETLDSDEAFEAFLEDLRKEMVVAIRNVVTCKPDYLVMGMSAETFWGGAAGNDRFVAWVEEQCGLKVSTGASACRAALETLGAKRIAVITPYQPVGDREVRRFFEDLGFEVSVVHGLKCPTATSIADVTDQEVREAFLAVDGDDVDALVQCGTNLAAVTVAPALEQELGKPVVAINAATVWHALRANGIDDRLPGYGRLFEEY
jgi:maleate isomerase